MLWENTPFSRLDYFCVFKLKHALFSKNAISPVEFDVATALTVSHRSANFPRRVDIDGYEHTTSTVNPMIFW